MSLRGGTGISRPETFLLLASLLLQLGIAALPDPFPGGAVITDIDDYRNWLRVLTLQGLEVAYWGEVKPQVDYPPLIPYLHIALGSILHTLSPTAFFSNEVINFLIKVPPVMANTLIGYLLLRERKILQLSQHRWAAPFLAFSPPLIFDIAYWGQTDSLTGLFLLMSMLLLRRERLTASFVVFTIACFIKPLAWPFSFLILFVSLCHFSLRHVCRAALAALMTAGIILLPFILDGNFVRILIRLFTQLDVQPYISINAHNFWWLIATPAGRWTTSTDLILGVITYKTIAAGLFLLCTFIILAKARSNLKKENFDLLYTASMVAIAFFVFSPQMHENHLFNFFPLAFLLMLRKDAEPFYRRSYITLTLCSFFNMLLHDHYLMVQLGEMVWNIAGESSGRATGLILKTVILLLTLLNALVICMIFVQLMWRYCCERAIPLAWNIGIGMTLGGIALARTAM